MDCPVCNTNPKIMHTMANIIELKKQCLNTWAWSSTFEGTKLPPKRRFIGDTLIVWGQFP